MHDPSPVTESESVWRRRVSGSGGELGWSESRDQWSGAGSRTGTDQCPVVTCADQE